MAKPERQIARAIVVRAEQLLLIERQHYAQHFYSLPGGGVEADETPEAAALRELAEETSIIATQPRLVYEEHLRPFGHTMYYVCRYSSGQPALDPSSEEASATARGDNTYRPMWVTIDKLEGLPLLPPLVEQRILIDLKNQEWPEIVIALDQKGPSNA